MSIDTQDPEDTTKLCGEYRDTPIFSRRKASGAIEFRCSVPTVARKYAFKADSINEMKAKIDIALDAS